MLRVIFGIFCYTSMITILKNQINIVYLTLSDTTTVTTPSYLFEVKNSTTLEVKYFTGSYNENGKYQIFYIVDSATEDLNNCVVDFNLTGFYEYKLYQERSGLTPVGEPIQYGKLQVIGTPYTDSYYTNQTTTNKVYEQ